jgi:hypothetical protein
VIPGSLDDLTREWLASVLPGGERLRTVDVVPFGEGVAFLGRLARLRLTWDEPENGPPSLVAKLPTDDPGGRTVGTMLNVWYREHRFYTDLAPHLGDLVPRPHFAGADHDTGAYVLLLEDLAPAAPGDQVAGASLEDAVLAVETLARLQAPWWGAPRTELTEWLPGIDRPGVSQLADVIAAALPRFGERFADVVDAAALSQLADRAPGIPGLLAAFANGPLTVAHADYRVENLLFSSDGRLWVLDWQTAMITAGVTDLAFFCGTNLTVADRRRFESELVERYVDVLRRDGVATELTTTVAEDYRRSMWWWFGMLANNLSSIEPRDDRGRALFSAMAERISVAATDHA